MTYKFIINESIQNKLERIEKLKVLILDERIYSPYEEEFSKFGKIKSIHFSTKIEANRLNIFEVTEIIDKGESRTRFEKDIIEIKGYIKAYERMLKFISIEKEVTETEIKLLHALVLSRDNNPSSYRDGQNAIFSNGAIVYMPPEAKDVPNLMKEMVKWVNDSIDTIPIPIIAGIAHYQFVTIHPFMDGNGRTTRLLTNSILYKYGYKFDYLYSLEEFYVNNLNDYYKSLRTSQLHNYYDGRHKADITHWLEYFLSGMIDTFEKLLFDILYINKVSINMEKSEFKLYIDKILDSSFVDEIYIMDDETGNWIYKFTDIQSNILGDNEDLWKKLPTTNIKYKHAKGLHLVSKHGGGMYEPSEFNFNFYQNLINKLK